MGEVIDLGVKQGLVDKSGAWYAYNGNKIGQGKANAAKFLLDNQDIAEVIESKIRQELLGSKKAPELQVVDDTLDGAVGAAE